MHLGWVAVCSLLISAPVRGSEEEFQRDESAKFNQLQSNRLAGRSSEEEQITFDNDDEFVRYEPDTCDLSGLWYNQHGSELYINQTATGKLSGEFRTNVELKTGSAGETFSLLSGTVSGRMFSFHVVWGSNGASMTTWIGQCHQKCNIGFYRTSSRDTILHSTWVMASRVASCEQSWSGNRIGQDSFMRRPLSSGPRRSLGKNTPARRS